MTKELFTIWLSFLMCILKILRNSLAAIGSILLKTVRNFTGIYKNITNVIFL